MKSIFELLNPGSFRERLKNILQDYNPFYNPWQKAISDGINDKTEQDSEKPEPLEEFYSGE